MYIYYVSLGGALRAPLDVRDKIHIAAAEAGAPAAAPAAEPWIHVFYHEPYFQVGSKVYS